MGRLHKNLLLGALLAAMVAAGSPYAAAHEGHDHGDAPPPVSREVAPRAEAASDAFELVAVARGTDLVVYLDMFRTNEPVTGATLEIDTLSGTLKPVEKSPGVYSVAAPFLTQPGSYDLAVTVRSGVTVDLLATTLRTVVQQAAKSAVGNGAGLVTPALAGTGRLPSSALDARVLGAGLAGLIIGVAGTLLWRRRRAAPLVVLLVASVVALGAFTDARAETLPVALRDVAQRFPDGTIFVGKATQQILALRTEFTEQKGHARAIELPGRIVADPNASGLVQASIGGRLYPPEGGFKPLGTPVKAGDVLALIRPPLPLADATVQAQQARELDQQISIVSNRLTRYRALAPSGAIARTQLDEAELEFKGLQERRANLDRVKRQPEELTAPVDGVIASANAVAGQMAEPNAVIFQIIDPAKLWVEALSFEPRGIKATATGRLADGRALELRYLGTGLADRNQSVPVQFAIIGDINGVRPGQFLTVLAQTEGERRGIAIPRTSVLRGANGQSIIYEHVSAERFAPREVRVEPLDGERVLVIAGMEAGKRVVTQGAELLNQIR
ncbi:MAG: efflux RND transporter periplasmic adaptor subunit [Proteobacteria bacterium]|nr:efflux RND transporter periplasmic adaptor subunit [Pseudomonadota bacterium]